MRKWIYLCCLALSLLMGGIISAAAVDADTVAFADVNLEAAVRDALQKPTGDITKQDMGQLTKLDASGRGIVNLNGIEYAVNLQSLNLSKNALSDVAKLGSLTNLQTLILNSNQIMSIDSLASLNGLKSLWLSDNQISSLSAVSSLQQLENLYVANNRINSLAGMEGLLQLKDLNAAYNQIGDIAPLTPLTQLLSLNLEGNRIPAVDGMETLGQLEWLSLANNPVTDLTPLSSLSQLVYLNQRGYAVSAASRQVLQDLESRGGIVEYTLVIPDGAYIYDVNRDGIADTNDVNDIINYYLNLNDMKNKHPELTITGNEIDPTQLEGSAYIYDINRDGTADTNDVNDAINYYLNLNDMKTKHPEFNVVVK